MHVKQLGNLILAEIATYMKTMPEELGQAWVDFADAVAEVVADPHSRNPETIGKLCVAAVDLP